MQNAAYNNRVALQASMYDAQLMRRLANACTQARRPAPPLPLHPATAPASQSASRRAKRWLAAALRFGCGRSAGGPRWAFEGLRLSS